MSTNAITNDLLESIRDHNYKKTCSLLDDRDISLDEQGAQGWTALMMAARQNDVEIVQTLLRKRVNTTIKNDLGQTAADVAMQFKSRAALNVLKSQKRLTSVKYPTINYFSHVPLNRRADKRKDSAWLESMKTNPKSKYVLFSNLKPLAIKLEGGNKYRLSIMNYPQIENILGEESNRLKNVVFLGIEENFPENDSECSQASNVNDGEKGCAWFAVDVRHIPLASGKILESCPGTEYLSPRPGFFQVNVEDATILAQARPILEWHQFYKFCPSCGNAVTMDDGGYKQTCTND